MKKKIFVTRRLLKENEEKLQSLFEVTLNKDDKIYSPQEIISRSKNYDGILSSVTDPINADTISKLSNSIKIIANGAVGFGNIDIQAAKDKGITVTNTPNSTGIIHAKEQSSWTVAPHHFSCMNNTTKARARGGIDVGDSAYTNANSSGFNSGSTNNNRVYLAGWYRVEGG